MPNKVGLTLLTWGARGLINPIAVACAHCRAWLSICAPFAHQLLSHIKSAPDAAGALDMIDPDRTLGKACRINYFLRRQTGGVSSCQHLCSLPVGQDSLGPRSRAVSSKPVTRSL